MQELTDDELIAYGVKALRENLDILFARVQREVKRRNRRDLWDRFKDIQSDPENVKYEPDSTTDLDPFHVVGGNRWTEGKVK